MELLRRLLFFIYQTQAAFGGGPGGALDALLMEDGVSGILLEDGTSDILLELTPSTEGEAVGLLLVLTKAA